MAHFAEIDASTNTVLRVLAVPDDEEHRGQEFLADDLGMDGTWVQTSYNTYGNGRIEGREDGAPLRYNFAFVGGTYDPVADAFYTPCIFPSWSLDENFLWQPPTAKPDDGKDYHWDENTTSWVEDVVPDLSVPIVWDEDTTSWVEITE